MINNYYNEKFKILFLKNTNIISIICSCIYFFRNVNVINGDEN